MQGCLEKRHLLLASLCWCSSPPCGPYRSSGLGQGSLRRPRTRFSQEFFFSEGRERPRYPTIGSPCRRNHNTHQLHYRPPGAGTGDRTVLRGKRFNPHTAVRGILQCEAARHPTIFASAAAEPRQGTLFSPTLSWGKVRHQQTAEPSEASPGTGVNAAKRKANDARAGEKERRPEREGCEVVRGHSVGPWRSRERGQ